MRRFYSAVRKMCKLHKFMSFSPSILIEKFSQHFRFFLLTNRPLCDIIVKSSKDVRFLGVAQLGERYLGVVEAASSSLVT